jgi:hypothetical protein
VNYFQPLIGSAPILPVTLYVRNGSDLPFTSTESTNPISNSSWTCRWVLSLLRIGHCFYGEMGWQVSGELKKVGHTAHFPLKLMSTSIFSKSLS